MGTAVIGMGSNLGDRQKNLDAALHSLSLLPQTSVKAVSHVYKTAPVGYASQEDFFNAAIMLSTSLSPLTLLGACLGIEAAAGRVRSIKNGPRVLDLDLLLYDCVHSDTFELTLPHPRILERAFVMLPLLELYPLGRAPGLHFAPHLRDIIASGSQSAEKLDIELSF